MTARATLERLADRIAADASDGTPEDVRAVVILYDRDGGIVLRAPFARVANVAKILRALLNAGDEEREQPWRS